MDDWKDDLHFFFRPEDDHRLDEPRAQASQFIQDVVLPAFAEVAHELAGYGRELRITSRDASAIANIRNRGRDEFTFTVEVQFRPDGLLQPIWTSEYSLPGGSFGKDQTRVNNQTTADLTKDEVARTFTKQYLNSMRNRAQQA